MGDQRSVAEMEPGSVTMSSAAQPKLEDKRVRPFRSFGFVAGVGLTALTLAALSAFIVTGKGSKPAASPFELQVEEEGPGWGIRWNTDKAPITQARKARLEIQETDQRPQIITMDGDQVRGGYVYYGSSGQPLRVGLEVVDKYGNTSRESVLVAASSQDQAAAGAVPPPPANALPAQRTIADSAVRAPAAHESTSTLVQVLDNHPAAIDTSATPSLIRAANRKPIVVDGNLQAGNLMISIAPVYPPAAMMAGIHGDVQFTALIGEDGSVLDLQAIGGNPILVTAAADVVKRWVYRPTLLDGVPVEVSTQILVRFNLR